LALLCGAGWVLCLMEFARISSLLDHTTKLKGIHFFFQTSQNMTVTNFEIFSLTWALLTKFEVVHLANNPCQDALIG
jgi:hypothetical protein